MRTIKKIHFQIFQEVWFLELNFKNIIYLVDMSVHYIHQHSFSHQMPVEIKHIACLYAYYFLLENDMLKINTFAIFNTKYSNQLVDATTRDHFRFSVLIV